MLKNTLLSLILFTIGSNSLTIPPGYTSTTYYSTSISSSITEEFPTSYETVYGPYSEAFTEYTTVKSKFGLYVNSTVTPEATSADTTSTATTSAATTDVPVPGTVFSTESTISSTSPQISGDVPAPGTVSPTSQVTGDIPSTTYESTFISSNITANMANGAVSVPSTTNEYSASTEAASNDDSGIPVLADTLASVIGNIATSDIASLPSDISASLPVSVPTSLSLSIPVDLSLSLSLPLSIPTDPPTSILASLTTSLPLSTPTSLSVSVPSSLPVSIPNSLSVSIPSSAVTSVSVSVPSSLSVSIPSSVSVSIASSLPVSIPTSDSVSIPTSLVASIPTTLPASIPTTLPTSISTSLSASISEAIIISTTSSATSTASTTISSQARTINDQMIAESNKKRALNQAPALVFNETLYQYAQAYADKYNCSGALKHSGGPYGENLALGTNLNASMTVDLWYNEISHYNFNDPGFSEVTGHFTQLVWVSTTQIGCAIKSCPNYYSSNYYICSYSTPGNIINSDNSYFIKNVLPVKN